MEISVRSILTAGVAAVTASAVVIAPSLQPPPRPAPTVQLAASSQLLPRQHAQINPLGAVAGSVERSTMQPSVNAVFPPPPVVMVPTPTSIGSSIMGIYGAVEPWVQWGFELGAYAVSWIPWVGWLSPQVMYFYYLGERITYSIAINVSNWLDNNISFGQGLVNVGVDTINSFIYFANDQIQFWLPSLPPLPPLPPICLFCNTLAATMPLGLSMVGPLAGPTALAGPIGNGIVDASQALANVSNAIWNIWNPIRDGIDYGVDLASYALDLVSWIPFVPAANFELNAVWNLIAREGDAITGFAHDMINTGNTFVNQTVNSGLITATNNAFWTTANSIATRGYEVIDAPIDFALDNLQYFTGIYIPHATAASELQRVSSEPSISVPAALTDALRPLTEARVALKTELDASAVKAAVAVDGLVGDLPGLAAANELVKKARNTIAVDLTPTITQDVKADKVTSESEETEVTVPGKVVRNGIRGALANVKPQADEKAKDANAASGKPAKDLDKGAKKIVKKLRTVGQNVEKALSRQTEKAATAKTG